MMKTTKKERSVKNRWLDSRLKYSSRVADTAMFGKFDKKKNRKNESNFFTTFCNEKQLQTKTFAQQTRQTTDYLKKSTKLNEFDSSKEKTDF